MGRRILKDMGVRRADATSANRLVWVAGATMLVLFVVALSYAFYGERGAARVGLPDSGAQSVVIAHEALAIAEKDTDGDGLSDWEELLWGTDPNKSDTDGNGVPDSQADFINHNTPSSDITGDDIALPGSFSSSSQTATQNVARELLGAYMLQVRDSNIAISAEDQNTIVQNSLRTTAQEFHPPTVNPNDLRVVPTSQEAGIQYLREFYTLLVELSVGSANDYEIMKSLTGTDRTRAVEELMLSAKRTTSYVERMKSISVPQDAIKIHADFLSAVLGYASSVENIAMIGKDPVRSALGVQMILTYHQLMRTTIEKINQYSALYNKK